MPHPAPATAPARMTLATALFAGAMTLLLRLPAIGIQDPWGDEINNLISITEIPPAQWNPAHRLSYTLQLAGHWLMGGVVGMRLASVLAGVLANALLAAWVARRFGAAPGLLSAVLLALSPFLHFYQIDANHYSFVILAMVGGWWMIEGAAQARPQWSLAAGGAAVLATGVLAHPVTLPVVGAYGTVIFVMMMARADELPFMSGSLRKRRVFLLLFALLFGGVLVRSVLTDPNMTDRLSRTGHRALPYGLLWESWNAVLGDFLGRTFRRAPVDAALGAVGMAMALAGWWRARRLAHWHVLALALIAAGLVLPFCVLYTRNVFQPKYWAPLQPLLLVGIALAATAGWARPGWRPWVIGGMALHVGGAVAGLVLMVREDYLPSRAVVGWLEANTAPGDVIVMRDVYTARSMTRLMAEGALAGRGRVWLADSLAGALPELQQAEEAAWDAAAAGHRAWFISFLDWRERLNPYFSDWMDTATVTLAQFPALRGDPISMRLLPPPVEDPLALPRDGARPSWLWPVAAIRATGNHISARLRLGAGAAAGWRVRMEHGGGRLRVSVGCSHPGGESADYLMVDGNLYALPPGCGVVELAAPLAAGEHELVLMRSGRAVGHLWVESIELATGGGTVLEPLPRLAGPGEPMRFAANPRPVAGRVPIGPPTAGGIVVYTGRVEGIGGLQFRAVGTRHWTGHTAGPMAAVAEQVDVPAVAVREGGFFAPQAGWAEWRVAGVWAPVSDPAPDKR